ncbi:CACNA1E [Symbiodinium natans]|uniref:CACNA1E protein n=1 Tax=Symbiodinium natans TaxID=878477 RepID=A0A812J7D7_9DINO|nr:CACNA1E [Symbiodinium natans]
MAQTGNEALDGATQDFSDPTDPRAGSKSHHKKMKLAGSFVHSTEPRDHHCARLRKLLGSIHLANIMALVVLVDAYCTCVDIDARAEGVHTPDIFTTLSTMCLMMYTLEAAALLLAFGPRQFFSDWIGTLDVIIVSCGWAEKVITAAAMVGSIGFRTAVLRALRLVRIVRLLRSLKRIRALKELYKLALMMATCFKALLWCFLLCFMVMTVWAMLMVEVVSPYVRGMSVFSSCPQCTRAVSSVMDANLLLFKTVIAGDSWGEVAVPVMQEYPGTAIIFIGSLLSLVFGVLNLIVAVVVDTFADARQHDVQSLAEEMEVEIDHDRTILAKLFKRMDKDGSGQLTLSELIEGACRDPAFQSRLRVMDIDEQDLEQLFRMIDQDGSGTVEVSEFIGPLSRWAHDSKTAPRFIKYNLLQSMHLQEELHDIAAEGFQEMAARIDDLTGMVEKLAVVKLAEPEHAEAPKEQRLSPGTAERQTSEGAEAPTEDLEACETQAPIHTVEPGIHQPQCSPQPMTLLAATSAQKGGGDVNVAMIEAKLASAMARLEGKLDQMLSGGRSPVDSQVLHPMLPGSRGHSPADPQMSQERQVVASIDMGVFHAERGRRKGAKKTRNVDAFQKMYMDAGQSNADEHERDPRDPSIAALLPDFQFLPHMPNLPTLPNRPSIRL